MAFTNYGHTTGTTGTSGTNIVSFGSFKLLKVGCRDGTIRVPSAILMSEKPYRKAMVADSFFREVKALTVDSVFSSTDLVATIATYFDFNTSSAEIEAATAAERIRATIFQVEYLTGLGFRNQYGTPVSYRQGDTRQVHLHYFAFRSALRASDLDDRGPDTVFSFYFVLKLPQTFINATAPVVSNLTSPLPIPVSTTDTADELETLQFEFGNLEENHFDSLSPANMRALLKRSASILVSSHFPALKKLKTNPSTLFGATTPSTTSLPQNLSVTPKMDRVFSSSVAGVINTYTDAVDFLEDGNQAVFVSIFGTTPTPITVEVAKKGVPFEDTNTLQTKLRSFVSLCELFIFCSIVTRRYVGTSNFDRTAIITDVEDALSQLKLEF